ncbi:MAG: nucleoside-diphosphate kinase [Candidatus Cryptobacteroides sp.]
MPQLERTLVILKPCALQRGLAGEIISRFEKKGLRICALKMYSFTKEKCAEHYAHLSGKPFYPIIEKSMTAAPVVLMCLEGIDAVEVVRMMAGATNGRKALPGTIRGDYCMSHQENIVHASDSLETAAAELARLFSEEDFFEYDTPLLPYLYAEDEL